MSRELQGVDVASTWRTKGGRAALCKATIFHFSRVSSEDGTAAQRGHSVNGQRARENLGEQETRGESPLSYFDSRTTRQGWTFFFASIFLFSGFVLDRALRISSG